MTCRVSRTRRASKVPAGRKPRQVAKDRPIARAKAAKRKAVAKVINLAESRSAKLAAAALEKVRARREAESRKREAAIAREQALRVAALAKAEKALLKARKRHDAIIKKIQTAREALDRRTDVEDARWNKEKEKLQEDLRRTRE